MKQKILSLPLKGLVSALLVATACSLIPASASNAMRRGNPTPLNVLYSFYIIDSDDDSPLAPSYNFVDTTYGSWMRMINWPNNDNACDTVPITYDSINFLYYTLPIWILQPPHIETPPGGMSVEIPGCWVSTNGTISLSGPDTSPVNVAFPNALINNDLIAPLWADWEFRTTGDSSKVFVRVTADSFYVSFYNLALKGTNGQVRATFQVSFNTDDSGMLFTYKSFDGSFGGRSAAALIQSVVTIGATDIYGDAVMYLHKGHYFATNPSAQYNQPLHNHLAIRFLRMVQDAFEITNVTMPPYDRYEVASSQLAPQCKILNSSDTAIEVMVHTTMTNVSTGSIFYNKIDSMLVGQGLPVTYTGPLATTLTCGNYSVTFTISYRNNVSDEWAGNNTFTRYFVMLSQQAAPFREEFEDGLNLCTWSNVGADVRNANSVFHVADAPIATGLGPHALVLNRLDSNGISYPSDVGGDTLTSAPIDLSHSANVHLSFHYQRGLLTDSTQAGIFNRLLSGPEMPVPGALGGVAQIGDSLLIEGLKRSGPEWNPAATDWALLGVIPGGLDTKLQTFRVLLDTSFLHDHFRVRFRMKARNSASPENYFEDGDNFVIDAVHVEPFLTERTELEPIDVDLGNGYFTNVPRNLSSFLVPKVRILNNGDQVNAGICLLHLTILDALDRIVYDQIRQMVFPSALSDSLYEMPQWNIQGSQVPSFTAYVTLLANYFESYSANDTNIFHKTMGIGDVYGIDDGEPDTVGTTTSPPANFYYDFNSVMPSGYDTLRGIDVYYKGASSTSNWTVTIVGNGDSVVRTWAVTPTAKGWYRGTFAPYTMLAGSTYRMHFVMSSGTNVGGDASNGLVYYTYVDSSKSANNLYGELRPDILGLFHDTGRVWYIPPKAATADAGGYLLPMFRLVTAGALNFLPVQLVSLTAQRTQDMLGLLNWEMADEDGVGAYKIERAETGEIAGTVTASGKTGLEKQTYEFVDANAPSTSVRYRLSALMLDGSESDLGEVLLGPVSEQNQFSITAYPNPAAAGEVTVVSSVPIDAIEVVDLLGRTVESLLPKGSSITMDLHDLPDGIYSIIGKSGDSVARTRVSIVR